MFDNFFQFSKLSVNVDRADSPTYTSAHMRSMCDLVFKHPDSFYALKFCNHFSLKDLFFVHVFIGYLGCHCSLWSLKFLRKNK